MPRCSRAPSSRPRTSFAALTAWNPRSHGPSLLAHYEDADIARQAAVLAHGIAETQPFIEGNKRTALACLALFLDLNGYTVTASQHERIRACLAPADAR